MAHGVESMFTVGTPPWHGLGEILKDPPSVEDAIRMAGLDWDVRLEPLALSGDGRAVDHKATVRSDTNAILGVVGPGYRPLQNAEAFRWFQPIIESGEVTLEAAGSLFGGRRVWVLGRVRGAETDIAKNDTIQQYALLAHAHDGTLAIRCGFTAVRVVCNNTLQASLNSDASKLLKVRHTSGALDALEKVREVMDVARAEFAATSEQLTELARHGCDEITLRRYIRTVFSRKRNIDQDDEKDAKKIVADIVPLFEAGRGAELSRGTMWGAFNAVTEYLTHERGRTADARMQAQWFGESAHRAQRALTTALEFCAAA